MPAKLQIALDLTDLGLAAKIATIAIEEDVDIVEVGTPLIKKYGELSIRVIKSIAKNKPVVADLKTLDTGKIEAEIAFNAGADIVSVSALADDKTILDALEISRKYEGLIYVDLINVRDIPSEIERLKKFGIDYIILHTGIDQQVRGEKVEKILAKYSSFIPNEKLVVAGGINLENLNQILKYNPAIIIVGGAVYKSRDPRETIKKLLQILRH